MNLVELELRHKDTSHYLLSDHHVVELITGFL